MRFYAPIAKVDHERRMVFGYASTAAEDADGETITLGALEGALDDYMRFANIRAMHQLSAVGKVKEAAIDDKGLYVGAKIVDDDAWNKVVEGVYSGFSVGGRALARDPADRTIITKLYLTEISLVDRPSNPEAVFDCWKAADARVGALLDRLAEMSEAERELLLVKAAQARPLDHQQLIDRQETTNGFRDIAGAPRH